MTSKYDLDAISEAAIDYRTDEKQKINADRIAGVSAVERAVQGLIAADATIEERAKRVLNDIFLELHHRRVEQKEVKNFEARHENEVAREALLIAISETGEPEEAGDMVRRRMLLTMTAEEFYDIQPAPATDPDGFPEP